MLSIPRVMFVRFVASPWFLWVLLMYLSPMVAGWWILVGLLSSMALLLAGAGMLVVGRWRAAETILLALALYTISNPNVIEGDFLHWLGATDLGVLWALLIEIWRGPS